MSPPPPLETFPALDALPGLVHGFVLRHPAIDVDTDREIALSRLASHYEEALEDCLAVEFSDLWTGEQVHDCRIAHCNSGDDTPAPESRHWSDTDGLITGRSGHYLGIYVADCCAVYLVDPVNRACALVHSGKKGTELGIAPRALSQMQERFGSDPARMIVQLSPCIRPPAYEIDFAARIRSDCAAAGVPERQIHDPGTCTSRDLKRYYSYRAEKGRTGRHLAVLGWRA